MKHASLLPFMCGAGASVAGAEYGPLYCYDHKIAETLGLSWAVDPYEHWRGPYGEAAHASLPPRGHEIRRDIVRWHIGQLASKTKELIGAGQRVITIGGDHSMSAGSVAGARLGLPPDETCGLIWVDAHTDIHTFESSQSKALHGMPVATLLNLDMTLSVEGCAHPVLPPENMIYAGLRSVDEGEIINASALNIPIPSLNELRIPSCRQTISQAAARLRERCDHIFLSIDLDAFSLALAPSVGSPVEGGFIYDEIMPVLIDLVSTHSVPLIDIVEFNPTLPGAEQTYAMILRILSDLLSASVQ